MRRFLSFLLLFPALTCLGQRTSKNPYFQDLDATGVINADAGTNQITTTGSGSLTVAPDFIHNLVRWEKTAGPGTITFGSPFSLSTTYSISTPGDYTVFVTVKSGYRYTYDSVNIRYDAGGVTNAPPTISTIPNQGIAEDGATAPTFTVGDDRTPLNSLIIVAGSSNPTLIDTPQLVITGSGPTRTLTATPKPNASGTATISVNVSDGEGLSVVTNWVLTVSAQNDAPILTNPGAQSTAEDTPKAVNLTATDVDTANLVYNGSSSNTNLMANSGITFSGSGQNRTMTLTPRLNQVGATTVFVGVQDGSGGSDTESFVLTVNAVNDPPSFPQAPANLQTTNGQSASTSFRIFDVEDGGNMTPTATTSNPGVVPLSAIVFSGTGTNRTVTVTPIDNGTATIGIQIQDTGGATAVTSFIVTAGSANTAPVVTPPTDKIIDEDTVLTTSVNVSDAETAPQDLTLSAQSSDQTLVRDANIVITGTGADRTVTVTPEPNASGELIISFTCVDSGGLSDTGSFLLVIDAVNDAPFFGGQIPAQSTPEDTPKLVSFTIGDNETAAGSLTMVYQTDNPTLITGMTPGGSGANRTVNITPGSGLSGVTTIRAIVSDGTLTSTNSFQIAIQSVNDPPTISVIGAQVTTEDVATSSIGFTIADPESAATALTVSATTTNPTLTPPASFTFGGSGGSRTLTIRGATNQFGTATITVAVNDGTNSTPTSFSLTINAVNDPPQVSSIPNQQMSTGSGSTNFSSSTFVSGLSNPTQMQFAPDGRLFVLQESGAIRVISGGVLLATPFATVTTDTMGERGLLGIAFDPNFGVNNFVYVHYTATTPALHGRITRFTAAGNIGGSPATIFDLDNVVNDRHNGGALHFGPMDGKLYIAVGDDVSGGSHSQGLGNLFGKILRINADGTIPADNPFFGSTSGNNRAIYAMGLRNPWTMAFKPSTQTLYVNDVGEGAWEEINNVVAGGNYGWGVCEGAFIRDSSSACTTGTLPIHAYGHGSGNTVGNSIAGGAFYNPSTVSFPVSYVGKYFYGDFTSGWIRVLDPSNNSTALFSAQGASIVDIKVGPDGKLYWLNRGGSVGVIESTGSQSTLTVPFSVSDPDHAATALTPTASSSNTGLLPLAGITFGGSGGSRTVSLTPTAGQTGQSTVTITMTDPASATGQSAFVLTVSGSANTPPTMSAISNQTLTKNSTSSPIPVTVGDAETPAANLVLSATSSNPTLISTNAPTADGTVVTYYVSPTGSDAANGTTPATPFASLGKARDAIRALKSAGQFPSSGLKVLVRDGILQASASLDLTSQDSGLSSNAPIVYAAYPGENPRVVGGKIITTVAPVGAHARLNTTQENNIVAVNLAGFTISNGTITHRGRFLQQSGTLNSWTEISQAGQSYRLARYPNLSSTLDGSSFTLFTTPTSANTFTYTGTRPTTGNGTAWAEPVANIWVHGYWGTDWDDLFANVTSLNTGSKLVTLAENPIYGIDASAGSKRFWWVNVLEELDEAGEYYIDRTSNILYVWPISPVTAANPLVASQIDTQILSLNGVSDVRFEGISFEASRKNLVTVANGNRVQFVRCNALCAGVDAVTFDSATRNSGWDSGTIANSGDRGVLLGGGTRSNLTPGSNYVQNVTFTNFARLVRTFQGAVEFPFGSVGNRFMNNEVYNAPAMAIRHWGNDHYVWYNHVHHVCQEAGGDSGVFWSELDWTSRGNSYRYNLIHDAWQTNGSTYAGYTQVFYWDDVSCTGEIIGNTTYNVNRSVLIHGGRNITIQNNVFVDNRPFEQIAFSQVSPTPSETITFLNQVNYQSSPWTKYPNLANITSDEPTRMKYNVVNRNRIFGPSGQSVDIVPGSESAVISQSQNVVGGANDFVNYAGHDYTLIPGSSMWGLGWVRIPYELIGPHPIPPPSGGITFGGSGSARTMTLQPNPNQTGTATITVQVADEGNLTAQRAFTLTVNDVNQPPTFSGVPGSQTVNEDVNVSFSFTVADDATPAGSIIVTGLSSNPGLIPNTGTGIEITVSGATRNIVLRPVANANGTATITFTANDGSATAQASVSVTISAVNDPPVLSPLVDQTTAINTAVNQNATVSDVEQAVSVLTLSGTSSNPALVPNSNITFSGTGASRTITVTPVSGQSGSAAITIVVSDGQGGSSSRQFNLQVGTVSGDDFFVSTSGVSGNPGTLASPWPLSFAFSGASGQIGPGDRVNIRGGTYNGAFTTTLSGNAGARITFRCYQNEVVFIDRNLDGGSNVLLCNGNYLDFIGINFANSAPRVGENERGAQLYSTAGGHCRFFFCTMSNLENGIAPQTKLTSEGGNLYYGCVSFYNGYRSGGDNKGHNFYIQHGGNDPLVLDKTVLSYSCDNGGQFYSTDGATPMRNLTVQRCFFFMWGRMLNLPGTEGIGLTTQANTVMTGIRVTTNYFWGEPGFSSTALRTSGNSVAGNDILVEGNDIFNGSVGVEWPSPGWSSATFRGNKLYVDTVDMIRYCCVTSRTFQNNTYRGVNSFSPGGDFSGYVSAVGETGSSYASGDPGQLIVLLPFNDYPTITHPFKAVLYVRNPAQTNPLTIDISGAGIPNGQPYRILKAISMFGGAVAGSGVYNGAQVSLNMLAVPMPAPAGLPVPENSAPRADIFIIASP